jgi:hypothetical protein
VELGLSEAARAGLLKGKENKFDVALVCDYYYCHEIQKAPDFEKTVTGV